MKRVTITHTTPEGTWSKTWVKEAKAPDLAAKYTDDRLRDLGGRLRVVYQNAADDLYMKQASWIAAHEKRVAKYKAQVEAGILKQEDFDAWMQGQLFQEQAWALKRGQIARAMVDVDKQAMAMMNDGKLEVFAENANYMGFVIDRDTGAAGSFGLYDRQTVTRLIRDRPNLLPMPEIDEEKDYAWYNDIINRAVTQGILQGESLDRIVLRVVEETGDKSLVAMRRNARTAYTGAQNAGRVEGMRQARDELGIEIKKRWMATLDDKTRDAHGDLDGREADIDEPFESLLGPIMFPGDPDADPANVYNCRCTLVTFYPKYQNRDIRRVDAMTGEDAGAVTYREWKETKAREGQEQQPTDGDSEIKIPEFEPAKTRPEAEEYAGRFADNVSYNGLSVDNCNAINQQLNELMTKYPINKLNSIEQKRMSAAMSASSDRLKIDGKKLGSVLDSELEVFKKSQEYARQQIEDIKARFAGKAKLPFSVRSTIDKLAEKLKFTRYAVHESYENHVKCTVTHEYGHILSDQYFGMINKDRANPNYKTNWGLADRSHKWDEAFQQARKTGDIYGISEYANRNSHEFFAECFAAREMGEKLPDYIESLMKETLEDGIM